jgi:hypothetical protein
LLSTARTDVGTEKQVTAVWAALVPHFAAPPAAAAATKAAAMSVAAKASIAAVAVAVGAASAVYVASTKDHAPATSSAPPSVAFKATEPVAPSVVLPAAPPSEAAEAPRAEPPSSSGVRPPSNSARLETATTEADLLGQAQAALAGDPRRALSLAESHQQRFPHGVLVQEREVIAIEALERLGRKSAAQARAARFLRVFPTSAHRSKIESIVSGR